MSVIQVTEEISGSSFKKETLHFNFCQRAMEVRKNVGHVTKLEESPLKPFDTSKSHFTSTIPVTTHTTLSFITFLKLYLR